MFWDNIKRRLEKPEHGLGVRKDGQIVTLKEDTSDDNHDCGTTKSI